MSLDIEKGQFVTLSLGLPVARKTTTLRLIAGFGGFSDNGTHESWTVNALKMATESPRHGNGR